MNSIKLKIINSGVTEDELISFDKSVEEIHNSLHCDILEGNDYLGWINLPSNYDKVEFEKIKECANRIKKNSDVLVVIGIGGSYLGSRAVIDALSNNFNSSLSKEELKYPQVVYVGNNLSASYTNDLINYLKGKDFSINVISKSGTTTEPAIALRIFKKLIEDKYGIEESKRRIYVTTDKENGALKNLADNEGYETFVIPDNIGGRYSVLTAVGLLPIATSGLDIDSLMLGARNAQQKYNNSDLMTNDCYKYAVIRNILYNENKQIEIFVSYESKMHFFSEWLKQLYGESEGKDNKGIFPASLTFTTDLHSMGQYVQDGLRNIFETVINIENSEVDILIDHEINDLDGLNYLSGKSLDFINKKAMEAVINAHVSGGVPNIKISLDKLDEYSLGELIYFFEKSCAMSGKILGIEPFDQPGVEAYKNNMFKLLEKPGFTEK